ncbi:glycosyltransferase [Salinisphaera shabanensis T35B1]|uniref:Glycoprotein 3-alpha-L-fucosyltransferase n=1 Tax=Salinisphaera shabanensis E1L3A TaxID=1033802 RepID=U2EJ22_9GAMM|nr:glycosyltransferase family 2 protein [Salinisphaera shabanensis]ERJ18332.1 glycoprotein 3-alpha-L-fucosyltransferase [Salinisphaera shabanensis E1L3A]
MSNDSNPVSGFDVTVVVASHNRAQSLATTLECLCRQHVTGARWRVLAVDNASTDETPTVLERFAADTRFELKALSEPRPGKPRALNRAVDQIEAGLVVFIDDDVNLGVHWLQSYIDAAARWPDHAIFGGPIIPVFPPDAPAWVQDQRYVRQSPMFAYYEAREDEGLTTRVPLGPNMMIRRSAIGAHRFDERLGPGGTHRLMGDETEFEYRLARLGYHPYVYVPAARAEHRVRPEQLTVKAVWARAYLWGRSMALTHGRSSRGVYLYGVPLRYWSGAARAWLRYAPFAFGPRHFRLKYGWQWQVRAGRLRGYLDSRDSKEESRQ